MRSVRERATTTPGALLEGECLDFGLRVADLNVCDRRRDLQEVCQKKNLPRTTYLYVVESPGWR